MTTGKWRKGKKQWLAMESESQLQQTGWTTKIVYLPKKKKQTKTNQGHKDEEGLTVWIRLYVLF